MTKKLFLSLFLMTAAYLPATSFTFGESIDLEDNQTTLSILLENSDYCITKITEEKIYLKPNCIYPTQEGLFIRFTNMELVRINKLFSDETGCYIFTSNEE